MQKYSLQVPNHLGLEEDRAIKMVPKNSGEPFAEASVLKALKHPGIPVIYDLEEDSSCYYLIEEYLDGESLYACLEREGCLTKARLISYGIQLCRIIIYLHSFETNPILYLDLQPHNIMLCQGTLKLIDFDQAVTGDLSVIRGRQCGTRGFAAPEQYSGGLLDERTDIYAIGALLFYMKTGKVPSFEPGNSTDELDVIIGRCLKTDREERYSSVEEICRELCRLQSDAAAENELPLLNIAVLGSSTDTDLFSVSLSMITYLMNRGVSCLYREENLSGKVHRLASRYRLKKDGNGIYHWKQFQLRPCYGANVRLEFPPYDAVITDYGIGLQTISEEEPDLLVILCGAEPWEMEASAALLQRFARKKNLRAVFSSGDYAEPPVLPQELTKLKCYCFPEQRIPDGFWDAVFRGTDAERRMQSEPEAEQTAERRLGFWKFLKRKISGR